MSRNDVQDHKAKASGQYRAADHNGRSVLSDLSAWLRLWFQEQDTQQEKNQRWYVCANKKTNAAITVRTGTMRARSGRRDVKAWKMSDAYNQKSDCR